MSIANSILSNLCCNPPVSQDVVSAARGMNNHIITEAALSDPHFEDKVKGLKGTILFDVHAVRRILEIELESIS